MRSMSLSMKRNRKRRNQRMNCEYEISSFLNFTIHNLLKKYQLLFLKKAYFYYYYYYVQKIKKKVSQIKYNFDNFFKKKIKKQHN